MTSRRPNILWLMTDEQRVDSLGLYGTPWAKTPNLDALAEHAVVFDNAYTPSPVCMPCRLSLLSGKHPCETGIWSNEGNPRVHVDSLLEPFRRAGYATATFGKQHYGGREKVFDLERSFVIPNAVGCYDYALPYRREDYGGIKFDDKWILGGTFPEPMDNKPEIQAVQAATEFLRNLPRGKSFLLRMSFSAPHTPVVPPTPFDRLIAEDDIALPAEADGMMDGAPRWLRDRVTKLGIDRLAPEDIPRIRRFYYGEVAFVDYAFGVLLDWMAEHSLLENTIIAYVSDHGTHLGDMQTVQKGTLLEASARVPYFFVLPSRIRNKHQVGLRRVGSPVSTITLLPTLLELAGLPVPLRRHTESLAAVVRDSGEVQEHPVFSEIACGLNRLIMVRDGVLKLITDADDVEEEDVLIDLSSDPYEQHNLLRDDRYLSELNRLRAVVRNHLEGTSRIMPMVLTVGHLARNDLGKTLCPTCRMDMTQRVDDLVWAESYREAYRCGHCGQKFALT